MLCQRERLLLEPSDQAGQDLLLHSSLPHIILPIVGATTAGSKAEAIQGFTVYIIK